MKKKYNLNIHLVYVSSMSSVWNIPITEMKNKEMVKFTVHSWTIQEYKECVSNKKFVECVGSFLDSSVTSTQTRMTYYYPSITSLGPVDVLCLSLILLW